MKVKICGLTRPEDAALAARLGAWAIGVIFAEESPRRVSREQANEVLDAGSRAAMDIIGAGTLPGPKPGRDPKSRVEAVSPCQVKPLRVGVFVNADMEDIETAVRDCALDVIQLHGEESPRFCAAAGESLGVKVIKAVRVAGPESVTGVVRFDTDFILLDTYAPGRHGGTGQSFDWSLLAAWPREDRQRRLVLSGGLGPDNLAAAVRVAEPFAVDISSGVESAPGIKDPEKLGLLFAALRQIQPE